MKKVINYRFIVSGTVFTAPEGQSLFLQAALLGEGKDGNHITSSKVIRFYINEDDEEVVVTQSGSHYQLCGEPAEEGYFDTRSDVQYFETATDARLKRPDLIQE
jgi:hypothetical protein